ncbi:uncharacterized protein CMU_009140 [Cryptosporidium muris RN66]|uniref:Uncharacterized protein n=1 Tax=Cryptosporidium muris (strain RN66) TaxID=441375 RepID=B6ADY1_CRYMR|nr:uncharacterized protein CMU_009140 [Cryptosporidium muris RN66]EEA06422.1 hypothetical protein, conserved [Cryptosporidium muris RN66]|eukprot:XP_002140771.1 hypothetical protein [Cryptosporidium muris RN66]
MLEGVRLKDEIEAQALKNSRDLYPDAQLLRVDAIPSSYIILLTRLNSFDNCYFRNTSLECWEARECRITGKFDLNPQSGIQAVLSSIKLKYTSDPFLTKIAVSKRNDLEEINILGRVTPIKMIYREIDILNSLGLIFREMNKVDSTMEITNSEIYDDYTSNINHTIQISDTASEKISNSKNLPFLKYYWYSKGTNIEYNNVTVHIIAASLCSSRRLSLVLGYDQHKSSYSQIYTHPLTLMDIAVKLVSAFRSVINLGYLPLYFSPECILINFERSSDTGILNVKNVIFSNIGEFVKGDNIWFQINGDNEDLFGYKIDDAHPINDFSVDNKYISPELAISFYLKSLFEKVMHTNLHYEQLKIEKVTHESNIYSKFDDTSIYSSLYERISNRWCSLIFSGDLKITKISGISTMSMEWKGIIDKFTSLSKQTKELENCDDLEKDYSTFKSVVEKLHFSIKMGIPSIVFCLGIALSKLLGGKDILEACDNDDIHAIDCMCEWNACGDIVPNLGRVNEKYIINCLTGRRNCSVLDIIPNKGIFVDDSHGWSSRVQRLLWGCLNFNPSQRWTLGQLDQELRSLYREMHQILHLKDEFNVHNNEATENKKLFNQNRHKYTRWFRKFQGNS